MSITYKESPYIPGNGFSRTLESGFLVPKDEAQCSYFSPMGPFLLASLTSLLNV